MLISVGLVGSLISLMSASPLATESGDLCKEPPSYPSGGRLDLGPARWQIVPINATKCSFNLSQAREYLNDCILEAKKHECTQPIPDIYNGSIPASQNGHNSPTVILDLRTVNATLIRPSYQDLMTVLGWMRNNLGTNETTACLVGNVLNKTASDAPGYVDTSHQESFPNNSPYRYPSGFFKFLNQGVAIDSISLITDYNGNLISQNPFPAGP